MHSVDISPLLPWVYSTVALTLAGLAFWTVTRSQAWLDAHAKFLDAQTREKITGLESQAIDMGVQAVENWVQSQGGKIHPVLSSGILAWGAQIAVNHASGVLADNGASPEEISAKILAKLPPNMITTDTTGLVIPPPALITSQPLPPLMKGS